MAASRELLMALALLLVAVAVAEAAQSRKPLPASPDHPGKCYDPELGLVLAPGAKEPATGECLEYSCSKSDTGFLLVSNSCGSVGVGPGCVLNKPDKNLPYPQCCPEPKCS